MSDIDRELNDRVMRSLNDEFVLMEEDFDDSRSSRKLITDKLMEAVNSVKLVDSDNRITSTAKDDLEIIKTAMKVLSDSEKARAQSIALKLKKSEQEEASSTAAKDRIAALLMATRPGQIPVTNIEDTDLDRIMEEAVGHSILDGELRASPRDLS